MTIFYYRSSEAYQRRTIEHATRQQSGLLFCIFLSSYRFKKTILKKHISLCAF